VVLKGLIVGLLSFSLHPKMSQAASIGPDQPLGIKGINDPWGKSFTLIWEPVKRKADGTPIDNLAGYNIYRRDSLLGPATKINTYTIPIIVFADRTNGRTYYYTVRALDKDGHESEDSYIADSSPQANTYFLPDDGVSSVRIPGHLSGFLLSANNKYGVPLMINFVEEDTPPGSSIIRYTRFQILRGDTREEVFDVGFEKADVEINIGYNVVNGQVAQGSPRVSSVHPSAITKHNPDQLSLYWNNGVTWVKIGGVNNQALKVMQTKSSNLGSFQIRAEAPASALALNKGNVYPRVFTPNGDGFNDTVYFILENPNNVSVKGEIFDLNGRYVAAMPAPTSNPGFGSTLVWNGNDSSGSSVPSGEYIYRIKGEDKAITGTISVAR